MWISFILVSDQTMKQDDRKVVDLRRKILQLKDSISPIKQLSWRIRKVEELYPFESADSQTLEYLIESYTDIYESFLSFASQEMGLEGYTGTGGVK